MFSNPTMNGYTKRAIALILFFCCSAFSLKTIQEGPKRIVFFGDSITAGYRLTLQDAFPYLIQQKLDSLGYHYEVVNAGLSGDASTGGLDRLNWVISRPVDIFVLELGGNDGLRGLSLDQTKKNLIAIIDGVRAKYKDAKIILAGMQIPPNMGTDYTKKFKLLFPEIAKEKSVDLIPFLLEGVGGEKELNLSDGIHPNEEGHKIVAETVWKHLKKHLASSP